jgi:hypothetical protein
VDLPEVSVQKCRRTTALADLFSGAGCRLVAKS